MATTQVILLTLLPSQPRKAEDFNNDIKNLKVEAFDLTVKDSKDGISVGSAEGVQEAPYFGPIEVTPRQPTPPQPPKLKTSILQHFRVDPIIPPPQDPPPKVTVTLFSVATAVIIVNLDPATHSEFDTLDLRLVVTRGGTKVGKTLPLEFNVPIKTVPEPLPVDPSTWINSDYDSLLGIVSSSDPVYRAAYIFVPPVPKFTSGRPGLNIGGDGVTPVFKDLVNLVNQVLADDHTSTDPDPKTSLEQRTDSLDAVQSLQIARELIYDRAVIPLPKPQKKSLEDMYGNPDVEAKDDQDRKQFEADLTAYHSQHDAEAMQLAKFVYAASAAIKCEKSSLHTTSARLAFDVVSRAPDLKIPFPTRSVLLQGVTDATNPDGFLSLTFGVPAAFFYALGCGLPSQLNSQDRLTAAYVATEAANLKAIQAAVENGVINKTESARTDATDPLLQNLDAQQAARRFSALGATAASLTLVKLDAKISDLVTDWLKFSGDSSTLSSFWVGESTTTRPTQYLELILDVIAADKLDLKDEITSTLHVITVVQLAAITDQAWRNFWLPKKTSPTDNTPSKRESLLPSYTIPGSPKQRTEAFIKFIKALFNVDEETVTVDHQGANDVQMLIRPGQDVLQMFFDALPGFSFANALDDNAISMALDGISIDDKLKTWAKKALETISFLFKATTFQGQDKQTNTEQFSLMESLYARGFITADRIAILSKTQFHAALARTIVYHVAPSGKTISDLIYDIAFPLSTTVPNLGPEPGDSFSPINPGQLVNCTPPTNLSPLGPIMYLKLLLQREINTQINSQTTSVELGDILKGRRGFLGGLSTSPANLEIDLPLIDLANESLEALVEQVSSGSALRGMVHDTDDDNLSDLGLGPLNDRINPGKFLIAVPQHSSPHLPNPPAKAYQVLKLDFSSPLLPYDQELDINRSYLSSLLTTRFSVMRTFRRDTTEFALDPNKEPKGFRKVLWRYPVQQDIAIEYLKISDSELQHLFTSPMSEVDIRGIYGFSPADEGWVFNLSSLPTFLEKTGLTYCEFLELWKSRFVNIHPLSKTGERVIETGFPDCEPCCLGSYRIKFGVEGEETTNLYKIAIFIRLWCKTELHYGRGKVSIPVLAAICQALQLFKDDEINPDFIRQLVALLMLCDEFCLRLCVTRNVPHGEDSKVQPQDLVPLLNIWTDTSLDSGSAKSAVRKLLDGVECYANLAHKCVPRTAHFHNVLERNLPALSKLAGFTKDIPWNTKPTCTLRFVEILAKIYASPFTVGEILFFFTTGTHLLGDDPFRWTEKDESEEDPLNVPEDDEKHGLWELRRKLLHVCVEDNEVKCWTWRRIEQCLRNDFCLPSSKNGTDSEPIIALAEHFFPHVLEAFEGAVPPLKRQFRTPLDLKDTTAAMWEAPPCQPFHYSSSTSELWTELPLCDEDVLKKLAHIRQLSESGNEGRSEIRAVKELYFAPRAMLAPFTAIFGSLSQAIDSMVQETSEKCRFEYFQQCFAVFYKRCEIVAEHLAAHVNLATDSGCDPSKDANGYAHIKKLAWEIIKSLIADENEPINQAWELDSGETPPLDNFMWDPQFSGSAFAALLGLTGTGILGEFKTAANSTVWKEVRGPLSAFGPVLNKRNVPVPMAIPTLNVTPTATQRQIVMFRNGFALENAAAEDLGAQPFSVHWKGILLVDKSGYYSFCVYRPACRRGAEVVDHKERCHKDCDDAKWFVKIQRGQNHPTLISHNYKFEHGTPEYHSESITLSHGAYNIEVFLEQPEPDFLADEPRDHTHTGFTVRYCGPDTKEETVDVPLDKLFIKSKDDRLAVLFDGPEDCMHSFLEKQYVSTLRDIRRTYQRAFKALLFAWRFCLSAELCGCCHSMSELEYMLKNPRNFSGASYYPGRLEVANANTLATPESSRASLTSQANKYTTHLANFDFNLLPVDDAYHPPEPDRDNRAKPSPQRSSALFDWWERIFDYRRLSHLTKTENGHGPLWALFYEAATQDSSDPTSLVRFLNIDMSIASLTLKYFDSQDPLKTADMKDERWAIRVWHAGQVVQEIRKALASKSLHEARLDLWAATSPNSAIDTNDPTPQRTGNQNLIYFVTKSLLVDQEDPNYQRIKVLNDDLRARAYKALVAYLCSLDRVPLNFQSSPGQDSGAKAKSVQHLSALLLQDIEVGLCQTATRISDAISSTQMLVQRMRLGLEQQLTLPSGFSKTWDTTYGSFELFQNYARRIIYLENWVQWEELRVARESEAFRFLENNIDTHSLAISKATPPFATAGNNLLPQTHGLLPAQYQSFARLNLSTEPNDEGVDLLATPIRSAQPTLLSSLIVNSQVDIPDPQNNDGGGGGTDVPQLRAPLPTPDDQVSIPMWFQAAVRLGTAFIRVAAAGLPPAMWHSWDEKDSPPPSSSCTCGKSHTPVMDEYYFWLEKRKYFDVENAIQDANTGVTPPDPTTDWERDETLPKMLHWPAKLLVHLHWTRVHFSEFSPPKRSTEGVPYDPNAETLSLALSGRELDSLHFTLFGSASKGFRYDIASDSAAETPQVIEDEFPIKSGPAGLASYPFFAYFSPGSPIVPVSSFGSALAIAGSLRSQCKFEEALAWCKTAFDPLQRENTWAQCNRSLALQNAIAGNDSDIAVREGGGFDSPCCPTSPVQFGVARARAAVMEYLRILLQWGDALLCANTFESRKQALVLFNEAIRLLGPKPGVIKSKAMAQSKARTVSTFVPASAPINPNLIHLYEQAYDKKDLIQRCIGAQRLTMDRISSKGFDPFRDAGSHDLDACGCGIGKGQCCLPYRFTYLLSKSFELAAVVKGLGQNLLSALEKGDTEYLASLRQSHDRQLNELAMSSKQNSYRESDWQVQALDQQLQGAQTRLRYNQQLLNNGLNEGENAYLSGTTVGMQTRTAGNVSEGIGQGMSFIPDFTVGGAGIAASPVAITKLPLGTKLAQVFQAASRILNVVGDVANTTASIGNTTGGWARRTDDWQHQIDVITIEITQIKRQQLAAERRRDIALRDLNNHQIQIQNSAEVDAFLTEKISKHDLYLFLQQETAKLYRRTFDLAWETAQEAKQALQRERRDLVESANTSLPLELGPAGWDSLRSGLMAGERLDLGLHSLERMYMREAGCREYELAKHISLRLSFPLAFLQLKMLGWCEFEIPEWMFDLDYPGHYLRRIKNVSVTIPCIVGPYVGINCRLQLLNSGTRLEPTLPTLPKCCCKTGGECIGPLTPKRSCLSSSGDANSNSMCSPPSPETCVSAYDNPESLTRDFLASEAIATSSGQNDAGLFELTFRDEKLRAPFEFAGAAASRWRVELPPRNNAFDLTSLTDFVLHLNYTAREGGLRLREAAELSAWRRLPGDGVRFFDIRSEFPSLWAAAFETSRRGHADEEKEKEKRGRSRSRHGRRKPPVSVLPLQLSRRSFPFLTGRRNVVISSLHIFIDTAEPCKIGKHLSVGFMPRNGCPDDLKTFECQSSHQTPGFFHGNLENLQLGPLCGDQTENLGCFEFPEALATACVRQAYLLCHFEAVEREIC